MKNVLRVLLTLLVIFGLTTVMVYATEVTDDTVLTTINEDGAIEEDTTLTTTDEEGTQEEATDDDGSQYIKGVVIDKGEVTTQDYYGINIKTQEVKVRILEGKHKDEEATAVFYLTQDYQNRFEARELKNGAKVYLGIDEEYSTEEELAVYVVQEIRDTKILICLIAAVILIVAIARIKGLETIATILFNTLVATVVFVFGYAKGLNSILAILLMVVPILIADILIINKVKRESWVAIAGAVISTILVIGLVFAITNMFGVIGLTEYGSYLGNENVKETFDYLDILIGGIVLGITGLVVEMAIMSAKKAQLGKSYMATIADVSEKLPKRVNSAYMVWLGTFLTVLIVFLAYERPFGEVINIETIAFEMIKVLTILVTPIVTMLVTTAISKELLTIRAIDDGNNE